MDDPEADHLRTVWMLWSQVAIAAAGAHLLFLAVFTALGLPLLSAVNVVSVAIHVGCRLLFAAGRNYLAVTLLVGEVVLHAGIATRALGTDAGFQFYLLTLVLPMLIVLKGPLVWKLLSIAVLGVYYGLLDAWMRRETPYFAIDPNALDALRYFNLTGMLVIMTFVSLGYYGLVITAEAALRKLATTDPLTGLHNRRRMLDLAQRERVTELPLHRGTCLLLCDIDHFKSINDTHGHDVGDRALQSVGRALVGALREHDTVARWGGEEFLVLVVNADLEMARHAAERIRVAVAAVQVALDAHPPLSMTITIGVARLAAHETIDAAIARADAALYRGKDAGRNRVVVETAVAEDAPEVMARSA